MEEQLKKSLELVKETLRKAEVYYHAANIISYDQETICPPKAMEEQGEVGAFLGNEAFKLTKDEAFIEAAETLYNQKEALEPLDAEMVTHLHRDYVKTKNITPDMNYEASLIGNKAYVDWLEAKQKADFSIFAPSLLAVRDVNAKFIRLRDQHSKDIYDDMLDDFERGVTQSDIDSWFGAYKERILPLLKKIQQSPKKIRTDFLSRTVTDEQQRQMAQYLLEIMDYDFSRGAFTTTEHPFTSGLGRNDIRITTHYSPNSFASNIYTIVHEGGHALFEQLQPEHNYDYFLTDEKTMGMHESVSRFYENVIGRSKEFIHLIFPKAKEIFAEQLSDVSEQEFYEAMNTVTPSLIRTDADEFTYTFHIIIRYEMEKEIMNNRVAIEDLPALWNKKYQEYLGIVPSNDTEGILQDVHWTFSLGYFPTYAIGNMYNAMYYRRMMENFDVPAAVLAGDFKKINSWMKDHVFAKADLMAPKDWIREICGREFTPNDFLDYLEKKYSEIYEL